jgi:hypothetical protein
MAAATVKKLRAETGPAQEESKASPNPPDENEFEFQEEIFGADEREARIAELAYFKAEKRGFEPGYELADWFEAAQEVDFARGRSPDSARP